MIRVLGSTTLSFMFPAERETAYRYYLEMSRVAQFLPHIHLISANGNNTFRLAYETTEVGAYHIRILCDVQAVTDSNHEVLTFEPVQHPPNIQPKSGFNSALTRGFYHSKSRFFAEGDQTRIEYHLDIQADLPTPHALKIVPAAVLNKISQNITNWRIKEIADGFIENSIAAFPQWLQNS